MGRETLVWRRQAVKRYGKNRLRKVLAILAVLEAAIIFLGANGGPPVRFQREERDVIGDREGAAEFFERWGIRIQLEDQTLWFYRETVDTQ